MHVTCWVFTVITFLITPSLGVPDPCQPNPCGKNTNCRSTAGRAVCSCLPGYRGSPLSSCEKGECSVSEDCPSHKTCISSQCRDVCDGTCGINAKCEARNHVPICSCPAGYSGDPFVHCRNDPESLCIPNPCGKNAQCKVVNKVPTCSCPPGYVGSPLRGCRPECESDGDCSDHQHCSNNRCTSVCTTGVCGVDALCSARNHVAVCTCPEYYVGNPQVSCRPECVTSEDCTKDKPLCWYGRCLDPCKSACGVNAECQVKSETAVCSCPEGYVGHAMLYCRPVTDDDYCNPNPCGKNAVCQPGFDNTGKRRPVCTCPAGYVGNALRECQRGECLTDNECRLDLSCDASTFTCRSPCRGACGALAECVVRNHIPLCACPAGYTGDASVACQPLNSQQRIVYQSRYFV
ncbi:neurogenic locus notch homolog protein 1-like [Schistocerca serialis cubense]|uniref:neurogenic locus notch homolog protein 1-like n=1 Tax=Schistocerca serialis cubense TaxID=2023355 RepID=UPI00214F04AF|nr:neurogenic locus notch homolog protein 1-like [Schistocerca serialis cubense]